MRRKKNRNVADTLTLEQMSVTLKNEVKLAKHNYYNSSLPQFAKSAPQKFWRFVSPRGSPASSFVISGKDVSDATTIANEFNRYFKSQLTSDNGIEVVASDYGFLPAIDDIEINEYGSFALLLNLDARKSAGPVLIPNAFKRYAEWIARYLEVVFRKSSVTSSVPNDWKTARIIPIHKSGNKQCLTNHRTISLTCTSSKFLEHILFEHISNFLLEHSVLTDKQYGFKKGYSTTSQLFEFSHDLSLAINE